MASAATPTHGTVPKSPPEKAPRPSTGGEGSDKSELLFSLLAKRERAQTRYNYEGWLEYDRAIRKIVQSG